MQRITLVALTALSATLISSSAFAGFSGLVVQDHTDATAAANGLAVAGIYASFINPGDSVLTVTSLGITTTDPTGFYQHMMGADIAPPGAMLPLDPLLAYDSFYTVGQQVLNPMSPAFSIDVDSMLFNNAGMLTGTWTTLPGSVDAVAGVDNLVLLAQLTVEAGHSITGTLMVNSMDASGLPGFSQPETFMFTSDPVPGPGSVALLGLAGAVAARRRRKM